MKTAVKSFFCMILVLAISLCSIPAFAAEIGDSIDVAVYIIGGKYYEKHYYDGDVCEGANKLAVPESSDKSVYYGFKVDKSGFYGITETDCMVNVYQDFEDGVAEVSNRRYILDSCDAYYLEKGDAAVVLESRYSKNCEVSIEYLGEKAEKIEYDSSVFKDVVIDDDIFIHDDNTFKAETDISVTFSGGKTLSDSDAVVTCYLENDIVEGKNPITIDLYGKKAKETLVAHYATHYVDSVEVKNAENFTQVYEFYNGDQTYTFLEDGAVVKVNFKNGTSQTVVFGTEYDAVSGEQKYNNYVTFSNGREYPIHSYSYKDSKSGKHILFVGVASCDFAKYECKVSPVSDSSNQKLFKENMMTYCFWFNAGVKESFSALKRADSFGDFIDAFKDMKYNSRYIELIIDELSMYMKYYGI